MAPRSSREYSERREQRRRTHRYTDSNTELISPAGHSDTNSPSSSPTKSRPKKSSRHRQYQSESEASKPASNPLLAGSLAQLDAVNDNLGWSSYDGVRPREREHPVTEDEEELRRRRDRRERRARRPVVDIDDDELRRQERYERREARRRREAQADVEETSRETRRARESQARPDNISRDWERDERRERKKKAPRGELGGYVRPEEQPRRRIISGTHLEQGKRQHRENEVYESIHHPKQRGGAASLESDEEYEARRKRRKRWICESLTPSAFPSRYLYTYADNRDWCRCHSRSRHSRGNPWCRLV